MRETKQTFLLPFIVFFRHLSQTNQKMYFHTVRPHAAMQAQMGSKHDLFLSEPTLKDHTYGLKLNLNIRLFRTLTLNFRKKYLHIYLNFRNIPKTHFIIKSQFQSLQGKVITGSNKLSFSVQTKQTLTSFHPSPRNL
jgi:hypothetical protein